MIDRRLHERLAELLTSADQQVVAAYLFGSVARGEEVPTSDVGYRRARRELRPGRRVATQVAKQLAEPRPFDLSEVDLLSYRKLRRRWQDWSAVSRLCRRVAVLDRLVEGAG